MILRLNLAAFAVTIALLLSACGGPPVRSTVDAYGEGSLDAQRPLCFVRDSIPLLDRPAVDACQAEAQARGLLVAQPGTAGCSYVVVSTRLASGAAAVRTSPRVGGSVGVFSGGGLGLGIGLGGGSTDVQDLATRELILNFYDNSALKGSRRAIEARSSGKESSVASVAREMCEAAFQDYPQNLRGKTYETKRRSEE